MNYDFHNHDSDDDSFEQQKVSPQTKRNLKKLYIILISVGLLLGAITAVGVVKILTQFGLTEKTPQFEYQKK